MRVRALAGRWRSLPTRTIRTRLAAIYTTLFILCAAGLLGITYGVVSQQYTAAYFISSGVQAGGITVQGGVANGSSGDAQRSPGIGSGAVTTGPLPSGAEVPPAHVLAIAAVAQASAARGTLLLWSGVALGIMALIATWLGWIVAGRALQPLRTITATARDISANNLHRRLALDGPDDELRQLGSTFDALLERLEGAFVAQRQFAANVSHELRTPLTFERTLLEVALADPDASATELRGACERVLRSGRHQERLIDALLELSRGQRGLDCHEPVYLAAIAAHVLASTDTGELTVEQSLADAQAEGDPRLVERLVANLVSNAVRHNEPGGQLIVATDTVGGHGILRVSNGGAVIAPDDVDRLFEPFERLDGSRASVGDGLG
ncbi:MAG: sensor histidine kinase, partial [Solirubrobacteraceae bacterium]